MTEACLLELVNVHKRYEAPAGGPSLDVLRGVSMRIARGQAVAVTGPSGCGKSTLLNLIAGLDRPDEGKVLLDGRDLADMDDRALAATRNRRIGLIFQLHHLLPQCTVWENVLVPTLAGAGADDGAEERAERLLRRVGLAERQSHRPAELSGGERQRVAAVRALINAPSLVLADEPTGSLDRRSADELAELLLELNTEEGAAMVVATHSMRLAERVGSVMELAEGTLSEGGPAS